MKNLVLVVLAAFGIATAHSFAVTNDLRITSITRTTNGCITLNWISHTGEFYTVYFATNLCPPIFWRVAEVNVPSGGASTIWSEGDCGESMMMSGGFSSSSSSGSLTNLFSEKELEEMMEAAQARSDAAIAFLMEQLEATQSGGFSLLSSPSPGSTNTTTNIYIQQVTAKFYRVARTAVTGFVDGWGGAYPPDIPNANCRFCQPAFCRHLQLGASR